jgi:hypothetical protein
MSLLLAMLGVLDANPFFGPVHRSIVVVDIEGSTRRTNPFKGEMRRILYTLLDQAMLMSGISSKHVERMDRGDGVLLIIRPDDEVPKTVVLGRLIPFLTALLLDYNASVAQPDLKLRLRAAVHAGEVHFDGMGWYGDDVDVACRLLDSLALKRALKAAVDSPLALAFSEEIFRGIIQQGYLNWGLDQPQITVRVGQRRRLGRLYIPFSADDDLADTTDLADMIDQPVGLLSAPVLPVSPADPEGLAPPEADAGDLVQPEADEEDLLHPETRDGGPIDPEAGDEGLPQRARRASIRAGMTWWRSPITA